MKRAGRGLNRWCRHLWHPRSMNVSTRHWHSINAYLFCSCLEHSCLVYILEILDGIDILDLSLRPDIVRRNTAIKLVSRRFTKHKYRLTHHSSGHFPKPACDNSHLGARSHEARTSRAQFGQNRRACHDRSWIATELYRKEAQSQSQMEQI